MTTTYVKSINVFRSQNARPLCLLGRRLQSTSATITLPNVSNDTRTFSDRDIALYTDTPRPTSAQLTYATRFFTKSPSSFLFGSPNFRDLPASSFPEVAFLGRSNVGKSSLLNALLQLEAQKIANVSKKAGRTRQMNAFGIGSITYRKYAPRDVPENAPEGTKPKHRGGGDFVRAPGTRDRPAVVVLDMPGYGKASRREWGTEIVKYLRQRTQLRRTFILLDARHGLKGSDQEMLTLLRDNGIPHQLVMMKVDRVLLPNSKKKISTEAVTDLMTMADEIRGLAQPPRGPRALGDVLACSALKNWPSERGVSGQHLKMGIESLRWAILQSVGSDCDEHGRSKVLPL